MRTETPPFPTYEGRYAFRQSDHSGFPQARVYNTATLLGNVSLNDGNASKRTVGDSDNFA